MRLLLLFWVVFSMPVQAKTAVPEPVQQYVTDAAPVGQAELTFYFWDVYTGTLFAPHGRWRADQPFALALTYQRDFKGKKIADRSVKEMRKQGVTDEQKLARWGEQMRALFPDVSDGDTLLGIAAANGVTHFYHNGAPLGNVEDSEFTERFFAIWLGENTSEPEFREQLLQQTNGSGE